MLKRVLSVGAKQNGAAFPPDSRAKSRHLVIYYRVALSRHKLLFRGGMTDKPPVYQWDPGFSSSGLKINPLPAAERFLLHPRNFDASRRPKYSGRTIIEAYEVPMWFYLCMLISCVELSTINRPDASLDRSKLDLASDRRCIALSCRETDRRIRSWPEQSRDFLDWSTQRRVQFVTDLWDRWERGASRASPSAAYGIAHDTEAVGNLALEANLSRGFAGSRVKFLRMHRRLPSLLIPARALRLRRPPSHSTLRNTLLPPLSLPRSSLSSLVSLLASWTIALLSSSSSTLLPFFPTSSLLPTLLSLLPDRSWIMKRQVFGAGTQRLCGS